MFDSQFFETAALSQEECLDYLGQVSLGRIAASIDALPVILPVQFLLTGEFVLFALHAGSTFETSPAGAVVAFQADAFEPGSENHWSV
jgi:hypothetical protein